MGRLSESSGPRAVYLSPLVDFKATQFLFCFPSSQQEALVQVFTMKVGHQNQEMVVKNKVSQQQNVYVDKTIPQV